MIALNNLVNKLFEGSIGIAANVGRGIGNYTSNFGRYTSNIREIVGYARNNPIESLGYVARNGLKSGLLATLLFIGCKIGDGTLTQYPAKTPTEYPTSTAPVPTIAPTPEIKAIIKAIDEQLKKLGTPIPTATPYSGETLTSTLQPPQEPTYAPDTPEQALTPTPTLSIPTKMPYILQECTTEFQQVKSGIISPKSYLQDLEQCLPEVVNAKNSGMLKGVIYQPSDRELENLLRELYAGRTNDEQSLQYIVQSTIDDYKNMAEEGVPGMMAPGDIGIFGQGVPLYLIFIEELVSSPSINNDADIRSAVKHELRHVEDWYNGIQLDGVNLSFDTISQGRFRTGLLEQLIELRVVYRELEDIFRESVETGRFSVSTQWAGSQAANYYTYWNSLERDAENELEIRVRDLQLEQFKGIKPEIINGELFLIFELFGKQGTAVISETLIIPEPTH